jgi:tyrosine aminotransferase
MGSGCSGTLELAITGILDEGTNLLVPQPGFPLYEVIADSHGASVKKYRLLAEKGWEADLAHMESLIDTNTRGIVVNNPSNPCGSVYSKAHLLEILKVAERHHLPIIADEIYGNLCFEGFKMHAMAELSKTVPIITTSGMAKEFIVPGWRVGWLLIHDPVGALDELRKGLHNLSQIIIGANSIVQAAIPSVLDPAVGSKDEAELNAFRKRYVGTLSSNCAFTFKRLSQIKGLSLIVPKGAMYMMVGVEIEHLDLKDDCDFAEKLLTEEAVFVLPGQCFGMKNFFRVVCSAPQEKLEEAYSRLEDFCKRHAIK